jgi:hypothetical protein
LDKKAEESKKTNMHEREEEAFGKLLAGERTLTAVEKSELVADAEGIAIIRELSTATYWALFYAEHENEKHGILQNVMSERLRRRVCDVSLLLRWNKDGSLGSCDVRVLLGNPNMEGDLVIRGVDINGIEALADLPKLDYPSYEKGGWRELISAAVGKPALTLGSEGFAMAPDEDLTTIVENVKKEEKEYLRTKAEKSRKLSDLTVGEFEEMLKAVVKEKALGGVEVN